MAFTQFMPVLHLYCSDSKHTIPGEASFSQQAPQSDYRNDSVIQGEIEAGNLLPLHSSYQAKYVPP
jgi:hypothetical protein